jgi:hypothetical protein
MSRAHDYLKQTIQHALGADADAFWTEYHRLAQLDARDGEAKLYRRQLLVAREKLVEWTVRADEPGAAAQMKRQANQCDRARAWLEKHGYSETEDD